jgi:hypothetical protein
MRLKNRLVKSALSGLGTVVLLFALGVGCYPSHQVTCLPDGEVIRTGHTLVSLTELTSPARGRNITSASHEDRITAAIEPLRGGSAQLEIRLVTAPDVVFWKAVEVRQGSQVPPSLFTLPGCYRPKEGESITMADTHGDRHTSTVLLRNDLAESSSLLLWKAKTAFQVHTPMYQLSGNLGALRGQRLTIYWEVD